MRYVVLSWKRRKTLFGPWRGHSVSVSPLHFSLGAQENIHEILLGTALK